MSFSPSSKAPKGYESFSTFNPQQQQLFQMLANYLSQGGFGQAQQYQQDLLSGSPEAYARFEAPYRRQFEEQIVPGLAERFAGMGAGAQSSSAFQQALGSAGADLSERLATLREGLRYQASQRPFQQLESLLGMQTQGLVPKQRTSFWKQLLLGFAPGLGEGLGAGLTGGFTGGLGSLFGGKAPGSQGPTYGPGGQQGSTIDQYGRITGTF